mgnify:CR=1 FL=1
MTHHTITDSDGDNLSPDETTWNIALARGDIAATLGKALAHLEDATARVLIEVAVDQLERLRSARLREDAEVDHFCSRAPEQHADAVRLARETGLRIGG